MRWLRAFRCFWLDRHREGVTGNFEWFICYRCVDCGKVTMVGAVWRGVTNRKQPA